MKTPLQNPKHEAFALDIAKGIKPSEAYAKQYPKLSKKSCGEAASRLAKSSKVTARIAHLGKILSDALQKQEIKSAAIASKRLSHTLIGMGHRRSLMASIADDDDLEPDVRMRAAMNDAKLAGELMDKMDMTSDGEAMPAIMPTITFSLPPGFATRRGRK